MSALVATLHEPGPKGVPVGWLAVSQTRSGAILHFVKVVDVERPVEDVYAYLADFENVTSRNYAIALTEKTSDEPVGVGTTCRQVRTLPSRSEESFEVTVYETHRSLGLSGTLGPFAAELEYHLELLSGVPG